MSCSRTGEVLDNGGVFGGMMKKDFVEYAVRYIDQRLFQAGVFRSRNFCTGPAPDLG